MSGERWHVNKRITSTAAYLLWCPRSTVHRAHWRGRILTTENTTTNHDDNVAREGNVAVQWVCREVVCHRNRWHFEGRCCSGCRGGSHGQCRALCPWEGTHLVVDHKAHNNPSLWWEGNVLVQWVVLLGGGGIPLPTETLQGTSGLQQLVPIGEDESS